MVALCSDEGILSVTHMLIDGSGHSYCGQADALVVPPAAYGQQGRGLLLAGVVIHG
jgi:hypothetical protein